MRDIGVRIPLTGCVGEVPDGFVPSPTQSHLTGGDAVCSVMPGKRAIAVRAPRAPLPPLTMITATSEHALRAVLLLARHSASPQGTRAVSADAIADALGAPRNYLAKTLNALAKHGIVHSARGATGGFTLAVPAESLTIARVVDLFEDSTRRPQCLLHDRHCDASTPCAVHARWQSMIGYAHTQFENTTIAQLLAGDAADACAVGSSADVRGVSFAA